MPGPQTDTDASQSSVGTADTTGTANVTYSASSLEQSCSGGITTISSFPWTCLTPEWVPEEDRPNFRYRVHSCSGDPDKLTVLYFVGTDAKGYRSFKGPRDSIERDVALARHFQAMQEHQETVSQASAVDASEGR